MAFGVNFLFGPVASSLCQRFSCRPVAAAGGLIAVLGFLMTSFANSVYVMYFTYSVVWGFGSSLSFAASTIVLGEFNIHVSSTYHCEYATYNDIRVSYRTKFVLKMASAPTSFLWLSGRAC